MSNYEQKAGTGAIFKNNKKKKETHPDYNGKILDPNGKGLIYQYSINLKEPLKRLNASTFQEARKKVEKFIESIVTKKR